MSLPVKSLSLAPSFVVSGKSLQLHLPRPLTPLPTRNIYNPTYFFNESYQHEIANHYRDYKRRSRMSRLLRRRRHARTLYVPYKRAAFYGVVSGERRPVLPMAVHDFPRFTAVYTTPRGRGTLCEDEPPDETYNATVRRIRQANTHKELKKLVERQLRLSACRKSGKERQREPEGAKLRSVKTAKWAVEIEREKCEQTTTAKRINTGADVNGCEKWYDCNKKADDDDNNDIDEPNANDSVRKVKASEVRVTRSKQQKDKQKFYELKLKPKQTPTAHRPPTHGCRLELSTSGHKVKPQSFQHLNKNQYQSSKAQQEESDALQPNSLEHFLHLACEYYEQGYLRNIIYLQAIGVRNIARRNQHKLIALATSRAPTNSSNDDSVTTITASVHSSATNTPSPTPRKFGAYFPLTRLLHRIGRKRSFKVDTNSSCNRHTQTKAAVTPPKNEYAHENPLAIRVNITPYANQTVKGALNKNIKRRSSATLTTAAQLLETSKSAQTPPLKCQPNASYAHSMNIYLNANLATTISATTNLIDQQQQIFTNTAEATATTPAHFHDLIDHLMQLEISDIDASLLPKITLTDCSSINNGTLGDIETTTRQINDNAFAFDFDTNFTSSNSNNFCTYNALDTQLKQQEEQVQKQKQQQKVPISAHCNGFTLRSTSLEIPDEVYYNSEARPP